MAMKSLPRSLLRWTQGCSLTVCKKGLKTDSRNLTAGGTVHLSVITVHLAYRNSVRFFNGFTAVSEQA
jgi:hypothetical protein